MDGYIKGNGRIDIRAVKCRYKDTKCPWNIGSKRRNRYIADEEYFIKMQCY